MGEGFGIVSNVGTLGSLEVVDHAVVEGEERSCSTNFSTHVTNRSHTRAGERFDTRTTVLDDSTSSTLDRKNAGNLEDDVCTIKLNKRPTGKSRRTHPWELSIH